MVAWLAVVVAVAVPITVMQHYHCDRCSASYREERQSCPTFLKGNIPPDMTTQSQLVVMFNFSCLVLSCPVSVIRVLVTTIILCSAT